MAPSVNQLKEINGFLRDFLVRACNKVEVMKAFFLTFFCLFFWRPLQAGLVPENKLLDLLDFALSANTVHTVRGMQQLLDLGVDALSLASQLATLITNLLAGSTFNVQRLEIREDSFFKRNFCK
jgi:hypothetical protein